MHFALSTVIILTLLTQLSAAQYQVRTDEVFVIQLSPASFNVSDVDSLGRLHFGRENRIIT